MIDKDKSRAVLSYEYDKKTKIGRIMSLYVDKEYRGQGIGLALLWKLHDYIGVNNKKIKYVEIDDCSKNYRSTNNIYLKIGAKYNKKWGPEMKWKVNHINVRNNKKIYKSNDVKKSYNIFYED
jgi:GNAT superfamily N-acetyltransferase